MKTKKWNKKEIRIREDRYVCATDMGVATGKRHDQFLKLKWVEKYLQLLSNKCSLPVSRKLVAGEIITATSYKKTNIISNYLVEYEFDEGGNHVTFFHPKLALRFAQWCSPEFAVEVDFWLDAMLQGNDKKMLPDGLKSDVHLFRSLPEGIEKWRKKFVDEIFDLIYKFYNIPNIPPYNQHPRFFAQFINKYLYGLVDVSQSLGLDLAFLKSVHKSNGIKGIKANHQCLSDDGNRKLLEIFGQFKAYMIVVISFSPNPETRTKHLDYLMMLHFGQLNLPLDFTDL